MFGIIGSERPHTRGAEASILDGQISSSSKVFVKCSRANGKRPCISSLYATTFIGCLEIVILGMRFQNKSIKRAFNLLYVNARQFNSPFIVRAALVHKIYQVVLCQYKPSLP